VRNYFLRGTISWEELFLVGNYLFLARNYFLWGNYFLRGTISCEELFLGGNFSRAVVPCLLYTTYLCPGGVIWRYHLRLSPRVARWYIYKLKIPILLNFGGSLKGMCWYIWSVYFTSIWCIFWSFGIFSPILVCCTKYIWQQWCHLGDWSYGPWDRIPPGHRLVAFSLKDEEKYTFSDTLNTLLLLKTRLVSPIYIPTYIGTYI
jgi:hypothetical protein